MAASNAILGFGTKYLIGSDASPSVLTELLEVTDVVFPNLQGDDVEVTHHQSPDRTREYIAGLIEPGECSVTVNWIPGNATDVRTQELHISGENKQHRITLTNGVTWTFNGIVKGREPSTPIDDRATMVITMKVAGSVTVVVPSP